MGVMSNKIERDELKPGDHVYSWRQGYIYAHHGIYMGDDSLIHYTRGAGHEMGTGTFLDRYIYSSSPSANSLGTPCPKCGDQSRLDGVIESCLDCFLSGGVLYRFEYKVNAAFFLAKLRGGTCTLAKSDPPEEVLHRAKFLLETGFGVYNLFKNNCEDFAIYCKTGLLASGQVASILTTTNAVVSIPLRFLITSTPCVAVVGYGMYSVCRLMSDIGVRHDVHKVPVEKLVERPASSRASTEPPKKD